MSATISGGKYWVVIQVDLKNSQIF